MLLRRLSQHVNDQNWFAVVLDFFIVVGGVLVAFQLSTWGEERAAAARADRSLHQLYEESEAALLFWVEVVSDEDERLALQDRALRALSEGTRGDLTDDDFEEALPAIGRYPTLSPPRRTYDELAGAGLLREIDAPDAMAAVASYYERVAFIQGQIDFFRPDGSVAEEIIDRAVQSVYDPTRLTRQRVAVDFDRLVNNALYIDVAVDEYRNAMVFQFYRRWAMHLAAEMCTNLAEAVGESCAALEAYGEWRELSEWQTREVPNYGNPQAVDEDDE